MGTIRELTSHRVNGLNEALRIFVLDQAGQGGACHEYIVLVPAGKDDLAITKPELVDARVVHEYTIFDGQNMRDISLKLCVENLAILSDKVKMMDEMVRGEKPSCLSVYRYQRISFQNGPVKEKGYNGNSHEALLAILLDRMESFQAGPYASHDNQMALDHLQGARLWLNKRTMDRVARNVEGTHQK